MARTGCNLEQNMPLAHLWSLLGWMVLAAVCAAIALSLALKRRAVRMRLLVRFGGANDAESPVSEVLLVSVAVVLLGAVLYESAPARSSGLRLTWAFAGAAFVLVGLFWASAAIREYARSRDEERREWRVRASEACAQIRCWLEAPAIRAAACRALSHSLGAADVRLYLLEEGRYKLGYETTARGGGPKVYNSDAPLVKLLQEQPENRPLSFLDEGPRLAVPAATGTELAGFFIVSGGPYHLAEQNFALEVARETARGLASAELVAKQIESRSAAQIERRELENTRRALQHLVAPDLPSMPGLDYAAEYWRGDRPGGQLLDIVALPQGMLGLVLADLPGIGLDAAARMAQLQTLLRSRFWAYAEDLPELLQSTERALRAARPAGGMVRIFVGCYRPEARSITYINAGALSPLLVRRGGEGAQVLRLSQTAPALMSGGADPLQTAGIVLETGDILAIVNPGLVDALSPAGESWGEGRLIETLLAWDSTRAADLVSLTLRTVEEHTAHQLAAPDRAIILMKAA